MFYSYFFNYLSYFKFSYYRVVKRNVKHKHLVLSTNAIKASYFIKRLIHIVRWRKSSIDSVQFER